MSSPFNLFSPTNSVTNKAINNINYHNPKVYNSKLSFIDIDKSYVSNWEIYSQDPDFNLEKWLKDCGV